MRSEYIDIIDNNYSWYLLYLIEQLAMLLTIFASAGVNKWLPFHVASPAAFVFKSACNFSHTWNYVIFFSFVIIIDQEIYHF